MTKDRAQDTPTAGLRFRAVEGADPAVEGPIGTGFVQKQTYRRRRLADSARALPVLGLLLWMVPLLWGASGQAHSVSGALIFIFGVWIGLIVLAGFIILLLNRPDQIGSGRHGAASDKGQGPER